MPHGRRYRQADVLTRLLESATFVFMLVRAKGDETLVPRRADE